MRDETARWLNPMLEATDAGEVDVIDLMGQATMPASETMDPLVEDVAELVNNPNAKIVGIGIPGVAGFD
jgi:hypothetical protein